MTPSAAEEIALPTGRCAHCARAVLTHVALTADGSLVRRCVHCDHLVPTTRATPTADLDALGYAVLEPRSGCGSGGGCGSEGCRAR